MIKLKKANPEQKTNRGPTVSPLLWELGQGGPASALKKLETSVQGLTHAVTAFASVGQYGQGVCSAATEVGRFRSRVVHAGRWTNQLDF
jgi:hypothetical protein